MAVKNFKIDPKGTIPKQGSKDKVTPKVENPKVVEAPKVLSTKNSCGLYGKTCMGTYCGEYKPDVECSYLV